MIILPPIPDHLWMISLTKLMRSDLIANPDYNVLEMGNTLAMNTFIALVPQAGTPNS